MLFLKEFLQVTGAELRRRSEGAPPDEEEEIYSINHNKGKREPWAESSLQDSGAINFIPVVPASILFPPEDAFIRVDLVHKC